MDSLKWFCVIAIAFLVAADHDRNRAVDALTDKTRVNTADASVQLEILLAHNWYRQQALPKPNNDLAQLRWNPKAAATAAKVARKIAKICSLQHSATSERTLDGVVCGENLAYRSSSSPALERFPWDAAVSMWGDERLIPSWKYNCASDKTFHEWGHYTQVVSERTTSVGCYAQKCKSQPNALVYVCHYCAAGNFAPLARPYAAASAAQKVDCSAPRPNFSTKPSRTKVPTVNELANGDYKMAALEEFSQFPNSSSPAKLILPPLQEPDGASSIDTTRFDTQQLIVFKHNLYRRTAVPPPLVPLVDLAWNPDAAASAAKISSRLAATCALSSHSTNTERLINNQLCGENLGLLLNTVQNGTEGEVIDQRPWARIVSQWGDERNLPSWQFGCARNSTFNEWGHYTQLVSERTTSVGCAATACNIDPTGPVVFACLYCAGGNFPPYNLPYKPQTAPTCENTSEPALADALPPVIMLNGTVPLPATIDSSPILADFVANSSPSTTSIDTEAPDVRTVILSSHNQYRREVCPRPQTPLSDVTWDFAATITAQTIAYRLANSGGCALQHSQASERNSCGENLGFLGGSLLSIGTPWRRVVDLWGKERDKFSYGLSSLSTFSEYGHYTQVVWEQTKSVGCAAAQCAGGSGMQSAVFVCHYCPAGNYPPINRPYVADPTSPTTNCGSVSSNSIDTTTTTTTTMTELPMTTAAPDIVVDSTTTASTTTTTPALLQPTTIASLPHDSAQPSTAGIDTTDPVTQDFIVNLHNVVRQTATNPQPAAPLAALTWNDELAAAARLVLNNTALMQNFQISCSAQSPTFPAIANPIQLAGRICTANAGASSTQQQPWQQVVQLWASDKARFVYGCSDPTKNFDEWGHYTQIVDGMTSELGCAALPCGGGGGDGSSPLTGVMFCVYCDSAKSKPDYALNKPYDASGDVPQCAAVVNNDLSSLTTPSTTTTTIQSSVPAATPLAISNIDTNQKSVQNFLLQLHNLIRRAAQPAPHPALPQLSWNAPLAATLQQTATQISRSFCRQGVTFAPTSSASSTPNTCGINVAVVSIASSPTGSPWEAAVNQWSAGRAQFQLGCSQPQDFNLWGQYTQMLGKNTKTLACAAAVCSADSSSAAMVCGYCGAGNVAAHLNKPYHTAQPSQMQQCSSSNVRRNGQLQAALPSKTNGAAQLAQLLLAPVDLVNVQNIVMPFVADDTFEPAPTTTAAPTTSTTTTASSTSVVDPIVQIINAIMGSTNIATNISSAVETAFNAGAISSTIAPATISYGLPSEPVVNFTSSRSALPPPPHAPPASVELTCPTTTIDNAISPWMALPNYNRCIVFVRGPTGRGKFQQCSEKVHNGSLLHGDSEALKSLIVLLRQKLSGDANTVIYEVSPSSSTIASAATLEARAAKPRAHTTYVQQHHRRRRHTPELNNRGWSVQVQQHSTSHGGEHAEAAKNAKLNNDFRSILARTARDRKFLDVLLGIDPTIEQRALDHEGRAVIAQDAMGTASGRNNSSSRETGASGHFVSPLMERFLHLLPPDACNFVDNDGFKQNNELACGIYQWTARHGYICQAPLQSNLRL